MPGAGRRDLTEPLVLPYLRAGEERAPDDPRLAVFVRRRAETGRTSWTAILDAVRLAPSADVAAVTIAQIREVVERLIAADQWAPGDHDILVVLDAGYDAPRIAHFLADLPVEVLGRTRSDRAMRQPTPSRVYDPLGGRPPKHGGEFVFGDPATWGTEQAATVTDTRRYRQATVRAWDRLHPRLTRRAAWLGHNGELPIVSGTVIRLEVELRHPAAPRSQSGCGGHEWTPAAQTWTAAGTPSYAGSTSSTPSE